MDILGRAAELRARGEPFVLATVTWRQGPTSGREGSRAIIHPDGTVEGWIGGACALPTVVREALGAFSDGRPRLLSLGMADTRAGVVAVPMACSSEGAMEVYVEPVLGVPHLHIVGSSPMTAALASMAEAIGWRVTSVDQPDMSGVGETTWVVIATQGRYDEPALEAALASPAGYIGLVASSKRTAAIDEWLQGRGFDREALQRVRAPAGLDLGPIDHTEIAVAILAELVVLKGRLRPTANVRVPEEAVDPVCGMSVDPITARFTIRRGDTTFYFCAARCAQAFESDPDSYLP